MIPAVLLLTPALVAGSGTPGSPDTLLRARPWRVVVLEPGSATASAYDFENAFVSTLITAHQTVTMYHLSLPDRDSSWTHGAVFQRDALRPDLLLVRGDSALHQLLEMEQTVFPGTPVAFSGVQPDQVEDLLLPDRVTGVLVASGPGAIYESARILQANLDHLMLIYGDDPDDLMRARQARSFLTAGGRRVSVTLRPLSAPQLAGELSRATPGTAVVLYLRRAEAHPPDPALFRTVRDIAGASSAPIYTGHPPLLGTGIAGVLHADAADDGAAVAALALGILGHPAWEPLPEVGLLEPKWEFDWRALRKWKLDPARLPFGSVTRYQPEPMGRIPGWSLAVLIVLCVIQIALIARMSRVQRDEHAQILEHERLRTDLAHATRVAMIGELSLSIASEINQPLAAIRANADAARRILDRHSPDVAEVNAILKDIRESDTRASSIVARMRTLLKKGDPTRREVLLNSVIEDAVGLLSGVATTRKIHIESSLQPDLPPVFGDQVQLEQVVINLLLNALDAIEDKPERDPHDRIVLRTERVNGQVVLSVQDTGRGLPSNIRDGLFQPVVPGRPDRLGVGLSVCRTILEDHAGAIYGTNAPEGGAAFTVYLPVARQTGLADA